MDGITDITNLLKEANKVKGDVIVERLNSRHYVVDAKSAMAMFSIDLSEGFMVKYPEEEKGFEKFIKKFEIN